jgi:hypothetical protein
LLDRPDREHLGEMGAVVGGGVHVGRRVEPGAADGKTIGTASTQPSAIVTEPLSAAAALTMHVPSTPSVTAANPSCRPAGIVTFVRTSPSPTAVR